VRIKLSILGLLPLLAAGLPAQAQPVAAARLIAPSDRDIFEPVEALGAVAIRHMPSGFVCPLTSTSPANTVRVETKAPRGSYAVCSTTLGGARVTYSLIRLTSGAPTAFYALQLSATEFMTQHRDARAAKGAFAASPLKGGPERRTFRVTHRDGSGQAFTRISVAVVGDWIIRQQVTAPVAETMAADRAAESAMDRALTLMTSEPI